MARHGLYDWDWDRDYLHIGKHVTPAHALRRRVLCTIVVAGGCLAIYAFGFWACVHWNLFYRTYDTGDGYVDEGNEMLMLTSMLPFSFFWVFGRETWDDLLTHDLNVLAIIIMTLLGLLPWFWCVFIAPVLAT